MIRGSARDFGPYECDKNAFLHFFILAAALLCVDFFSGRQTKSFTSAAVLTQTTYRFSATAVQVQPY